MNLTTIKNTLNTDKQCREYLANIRWKNGFVCSNCQSREAWKTGEIKFKCKKCGHKTSVTSGTVFQGSHTSLKQWFLAIWLLSESGQHITADILQKELKLGSNRTALKMLKTLKNARRIINKTVKLEYAVELRQEFISFYGKRIPILIAAEINNNAVRQIRIQEVSYHNKTEIINFIKNNIVPYDCVQTNLSPEEKKKEIGIVTQLLSHDDIGDNYNKLIKSPLYEYRYTREVFNNFNKWLNTKRPKYEFEKYCKVFCALQNSKFVSISFEELLESLLKLKKQKKSTAA